MDNMNNIDENVNKELKSVDNSFSIININSDSDSSKKNKYELTTLLKEKLIKLPEVMEFILKLQALVEKQQKKIQKLKSKKSKHKNDRIKYSNVSTQTSEESYSFEEAPKLNEYQQPKTLAEEITEAAQEALQKTGFVYEETSGMYYDYNSGYYYNAEYGLYYDGNTGTYLKFNQDSQEYEFHSQVEAASTTEEPVHTIREKKKKSKRKSEHRQEKKHASKREKRTVDDPDDLEEGECSDSSLITILEDDQTSLDDDNESSDLDYAKQYPPCMRIIIEETNIKTIKQGSLFVITYEGGSLGREGTHSIILPEINTSKHHLKFTFNKENGIYCVTDLGSRNGTTLNGKRMSPSKMESEPLEVPHGSKIQIGSTVMLCHVHTGSQTCGHCEPGLIQVKEVEVEKDEVVPSSKSIDHKQQLKQMRKKFGITPWDVNNKCVPGSGYTDRAEVRRVTVGSQNPYEKTQAASLNESIPAENKGFKLLSKMGWKEGESLGKDNKGLLEPVKICSNPGTSGMGTEAAPIVNISKVDRSKQNIWKKTRERYSQMPEKLTDAFDEDAIEENE